LFLTGKSFHTLFTVCRIFRFGRPRSFLQKCFAAQVHLRPAAAQTSSVLPMRKVFHKNVVYNP